MSEESRRCKGCCKFPNGKVAGLLVLVFAIVAFSLGSAANNSCYYARVDLTDANLDNLPSTSNYGIGLWARQDVEYDEPWWWGDEHCTRWEWNEVNAIMDGKWRAARALGMTASTLGVIALLVAICLACMRMSKRFLNIVSLFCLFAALLEMFTLIAFSSDICKDFGCKFSTGAGYSIGSSVAYFITFFLFRRIPEYEEADYDTGGVVSPAPENVPGSVSVTQTIMPDGTKKTVRTTVNADGSQTVEEIVDTTASTGVHDIENARPY